tara:strand:+ start:250 stop:567 length:318 start_codon:yes stop_codon:yes gene_type:complete
MREFIKIKGYGTVEDIIIPVDSIVSAQFNDGAGDDMLQISTNVVGQNGWGIEIVDVQGNAADDATKLMSVVEAINNILMSQPGGSTVELGGTYCRANSCEYTQLF